MLNFEMAPKGKAKKQEITGFKGATFDIKPILQKMIPEVKKLTSEQWKAVRKKIGDFYTKV